MKIIILGVGQVGGTLAENLVGERNDITVVDTDTDLLEALQDKYDLQVVVGNGAHPAPHGERHEAVLGRALHHVEQDAAVLVAGGDVQKAKLVGAGGVVDLGLLHRVAGIAQVDEVHALHDAAVLHVQAGDDAHGEHQAAPARVPARRASAAAGSRRPS